MNGNDRLLVFDPRCRVLLSLQEKRFEARSTSPLLQSKSPGVTDPRVRHAVKISFLRQHQRPIRFPCLLEDLCLFSITETKIPGMATWDTEGPLHPICPVGETPGVQTRGRLQRGVGAHVLTRKAETTVNVPHLASGWSLQLPLRCHPVRSQFQDTAHPNSPTPNT